MRLFAALVPPPEVVADGAGAADRLRAYVDDVRWVRPERLHVTLAFYGEVTDDAVVARLHTALGEMAAGTGPIDLALGAPGAFPDAVRAHVLWLGVHGDRDALTRLAAAAVAAGASAGLAPVDDRPYRPHATLGHARRAVDARAGVAARTPYSGDHEEKRPS